MAEEQKKNKIWNWDVSGFEPRRGDDNENHKRFNSNYNFLLHNLTHKLQHAREDYFELRREACDFQEYSNAKLERVTRYLEVLAVKARKLDQDALENEAKIVPLINEKKRLFNQLLTAKGNIKVFCRTRPLFEDEGPSIVEFPDDCTIRVSVDDDNITTPKKDFEFDRVFGPHVGQAEVFVEVQPFVQSALDGFNVSIFAYGQTHSGKTHTMEGSSHERGLYARCFEELFDISNSDTTSASRFDFFISVSELYNEQIRDLLPVYENIFPKIKSGLPNSLEDLLQEKVDSPMGFSKILNMAFRNRGRDASKFNVSHLIVTIHIYSHNFITEENCYSKLSLIELAGEVSPNLQEDGGEHATEVLHVMKSLSALGDVLTCLTSNKDVVPYKNSMLTKVLADSLGGSSKSLMIVNLNPNKSNLAEIVSSLNFAARARNSTLSLGSRDTIKKWRDVANGSRKELYEKDRKIDDLKQEVMVLKQALTHANDQCVLLFNEVQKAWKVSFTIQSDFKSDNIMLAEKLKLEKDQNAQLRLQVAQLVQLEQDHESKMEQQNSKIETLQAELKSIESQMSEALHTKEVSPKVGRGLMAVVQSTSDQTGEDMDSLSVTKKLEEELLKRDALIERLHEENEKLFERLTQKTTLAGSAQDGNQWRSDSNSKGRSVVVSSLSPANEKHEGTVALIKSDSEKVKTTPAGEYLTAALNNFDPENYDSLATISDSANKLLMLVLAAVIKAGASREHEILSEIRDAVIPFIRKMEPKRVMDTVLVSRVRILYLRSLLSRSPELQSVKVPPAEYFLEKVNVGHSRSSSRGSSPRRSPLNHDSSTRNALVRQHFQRFKINIKPEKKSKLSSVVLKLRGIDQEMWKHHMTGGKLREITEEGKNYAIGNRDLAALVVHTPTGELLRQIRSWLAESFDFLTVTANDTLGGPTSQLELLSTAIMDGWMAGLGAAKPPSTDALGQLLGEYAKRVYSTQLQHLKDIAGTLATEIAEDSAQVAKLRSALESMDHKRRKLVQQMRSDGAFLALQDGGSPIRNPSTAAEDARLSSLITLEGILNQVKDISRQSCVIKMVKSKKKVMLASLDELANRMPSLLDIDHSCARRHIAEARHAVELIPEEDEVQGTSVATRVSTDIGSSVELDVFQWNVLQFNTGSTTSFIIKCGANSNSELVIKADARVQEPKGGEIVRVVPRPTSLENMTSEEIKEIFNQLPEALSLLALARTADGTRARYSRLYNTLAMKVPALRNLAGELEKGGEIKNVKS
ncbi:kinesin-like protein KIN-14B isoform X2 [Daucus carota subsp. sativus]|uniref:kinesin-like protein KIN-14B isoform X2 n=1 Tax=Daucus carota subsp. sativus TaxID=79200 RepID=UPI0007EF9C4C|nr:PREDICTED: kinesin-like protein KCA2 isoform X2 [Daucus carota subsp. sativus]